MSILQPLTKSIRKVINSFGIDVVRLNPKKNLQLYESYPLESLREKRFYNIGSGPFKHPYWTNIDYVDEKHLTEWSKRNKSCHIDINFNLMDKQPFLLEDSCAELIYCSHVIEHLTDDAVAHLFSEVLRILKPGGIFRVSTPDISLAWQAYLRKDRHFEYFQMNPGSMEQAFVMLFASTVSAGFNLDVPDHITLKKWSDAELTKMLHKYDMEAVVEIISQYINFEAHHLHPNGHINWFHEKKLTSLLGNAGFATIYHSGFGQSIAPPMREVTNLQFDNHPAI